jgi:hypothetical protein
MKFDRYYNKFDDSLFNKCIKIARDNFWGSLMCNYFCKNFETFNGFENKIGYSIYDPYEFQGLHLKINSPISMYNEKLIA